MDSCLFSPGLSSRQIYAHFKIAGCTDEPQTFLEVSAWCEDILREFGKRTNQKVGVTSSDKAGRTRSHCTGKAVLRNAPILIGPGKNFFNTNVDHVTGFCRDVEFIELCNATVYQFSDFGAIYFDENLNVIGDISTPYYPLLYLLDLDILEGIQNVQLRVESATCFMDRFSEPNYAHWLLDGCSRLLGAHEEDWLITHPLEKSWQRELITEYRGGITKVVELSAYTCCRFAVLRVDAYGSNAVPHPAYKCNPVALEYLRTANGNKKNLPLIEYSQVLIVKRFGSREVVNMDLLENYFLLNGYIVNTVDCSKVSVKTQWEFFSKSDIVISVHGAALANLVFAKTGSTCIEIFPQGYGNPEFWMIANDVGCTYIGITDVTDVGDERPRYRNLKLGENVLSELDSILSNSYIVNA